LLFARGAFHVIIKCKHLISIVPSKFVYTNQTNFVEVKETETAGIREGEREREHE